MTMFRAMEPFFAEHLGGRSSARGDGPPRAVGLVTNLEAE